MLIFVPHSLQKAASGGFLLPQFGHTADSEDPHLLQNLESTGLDNPHFLHSKSSFLSLSSPIYFLTHLGNAVFISLALKSIED